jgi:reelin
MGKVSCLSETIKCHYLNPKRAAYDLPGDAKAIGVQLRWWQPVHDGIGHDQWAIDSIEIIQ